MAVRVHAESDGRMPQACPITTLCAAASGDCLRFPERTGGGDLWVQSESGGGGASPIRAKASISPMTARSTSLRSSDSLTRMSGRLDSPKGSADTRSITSSMRVFTLRCATWSLRTAAATASIGRCTSGVYARRASKHGPHGRNGSRYALVGVARRMRSQRLVADGWRLVIPDERRHTHDEPRGAAKVPYPCSVAKSRLRRT